MKNLSQIVIIFLLSFFSLSFTPSALCGGGEFDESNLEQLVSALQKMTVDVRVERFLDWTAAAKRQFIDLNDDQIEDVVRDVLVGLMPIDLSAESLSLSHQQELNAQQKLKVSAFIDVWIVLLHRRLEHLTHEWFHIALYGLSRLGANVQQNQGLYAFIDAWIASAQPKLEPIMGIYASNPIFVLEKLGANVTQNRGLPAFISAWVVLAQPKLKDLAYGRRFKDVISKLGGLGANVQQNRELAAFIDEWIRLVQRQLGNLEGTQFTDDVYWLARLGANVQQNRELAVFIDEWIASAQPKLGLIRSIGPNNPIFVLARLGANVTQNKGLPAFINAWVVLAQPTLKDLAYIGTLRVGLGRIIHTLGILGANVQQSRELAAFIDECIRLIQPQLKNLNHLRLVAVILELGLLGANERQNQRLGAFIDAWLQTKPFRPESFDHGDVRRRNIQFLRDLFFERELGEMVTVDIFKHCIDLIEGAGFFDKAQEIYNEAVDRQMFGLIEYRSCKSYREKIHLRDFFEKRNGDVEVVPFARGEGVTVWRAQDQADQFVEGIFNRMDGAPFVERAERPQEELLVAAVADDDAAVVQTLPFNFNDGDNHFGQDEFVTAVQDAFVTTMLEPATPFALILRPTTQEERIRDLITNENLWQRGDDGQTRVWAWPAFLSPGL